MEDWRTGQEILVMNGRIKVPYLWSAGEIGTTYLNSLKDEKKFLGTRCPQCKKIYHVPRRHCPDCFEECSEWVELADAGTLVTFTIMHKHEVELSPLPLPFGYGIIKLDGADTGFLHLLSEFAEGQLACGMRVEAVFAEERTGDIRDVSYFRPVGEVS